MSLLMEMFTYPFILRAFAVGILVSLCAALLGVPLVLKRYSMIGDGLSHVSFGALAVAVACGFAPLAFSVPVVVASAFLLLRIAEHSRIGADAAIAAVAALIAIIVIALVRGDGFYMLLASALCVLCAAVKLVSLWALGRRM